MTQARSKNQIEILVLPSSTAASIRHPILASASTTHIASTIHLPSVFGIKRLTACLTNAPALEFEVSSIQMVELSTSRSSTSMMQQTVETLHPNGSMSSK
jgi:hypothetical protein